MEYVEFTGKTVDDAITEACRNFTITSDRLEYEVIEKGTAGIFGFAAKPAIIKARVSKPMRKRKRLLLRIRKVRKQYLQLIRRNS